MAARYAHAMRTVEPVGPVILAGYSFGAHLAFEAARSLEAQGRAPALVVMIDTPAHGWDPKIEPVRRQEYTERVRTAGNADRLRLVARSLQWRASRAYNRATAGVVRRPLSRQVEPFRAHHEQLIRRYEPSGTYGGAVLVLRGGEHAGPAEDLGWSHFVTGPIETVAVLGQHEHLLREPWVDGIAGAMNDAITASCA
jgi:thioesterase domain-containing protein